MIEHPKCYNKKPASGTRLVQDGWTADGRRNMVIIPDNMTKWCHQTLPPFGEAFKFGWNCDGCVWIPK